MHFLVDNNSKIIFGWSPKCACSHVKRLFWFFINNNTNATIHTYKDTMSLPRDIGNYTTILFCRNPYKRVVSGFLDKYRMNGQFRNLWSDKTITFSAFINELINSNWKIIDKHHFIEQTSEYFNMKIMESKKLVIFDIENIDYAYLEDLYNKKIPSELLTRKEGHERKTYNKPYEEPVYDLNMDLYFEYNVPIKNFYNEEIKNKIKSFYEKDFTFFRENGIDYTIEL